MWESRGFVMIRQIEARDTKGGIIIPKDKFKETVGFQKMLPMEKIESKAKVLSIVIFI